MASIANKTKPAAAVPKGQPTLIKRPNETLTTGFWLFLAFFVPFILMFTAFALSKVYPFGDNQILATDLWHQYYPFLVDYHSKLQSGGSMLWTWSSGGGTNYMALIAYYTASPLNLLSVFFPTEILREFVYVATCVKIGLAGLFFALFLRITFKRRDAALTAFGIMYALCAFIMGYYWNIIWLDTIALMPLVIAGTVALLRDGKFRLYIAALALSLIANYYISLFTCIFVALVSIGYTIVEWKGWRKTVRDFFKMAGCTIVSFMISAVLIVPTYFALKSTYSSGNSFPEKFAVNMGGTPDFGGVLTGIGKTMANSLSLVQPTAKEGLPNVYCGIFIVFLAILFLFCSKIKKRERFYCLGLLVFFLVSFVIRQLDFVWHGFHFPNMLYHRFSFLFSFVLIYMAFRVFTHIDSIRPVSVIAAICGLIVYLGIAQHYYRLGGSEPWVATLGTLFRSADGQSSVDPVTVSGFFGLLIAAWVLLYSFRASLNRLLQAILATVIGVASTVFIVLNADVFLAPLRKKSDADFSSTGFIVAVIIVMLLVMAAVFYALWSKKLNRDNRALRMMLTAVLLVLALTEGTLSAGNGVTTVGVTDRKWYPLGTDDTLAMVDIIHEREADTVDLYRSELTRYYSLNDPTLIGVNGISMFNSMVNSKITEYMEKFGICGWLASNRYTYQESSPFTNLMLNIKYLISPYVGEYRDRTHLDLLKTQNYTKLMQNKYYLPMGFMVNDDLLNYDLSVLSATDPIANQNLFFRLATGLSGDLYEEIPTTAADSSTQATAPYDGIAVAYASTNQRDAYDVTLNREYLTTVQNPEGEGTVESQANISDRANIQRPFIMMIGNVTKGDKLSVSARTGTLTGKFVMFNEELFQKAYQQFSRSVLQASEVTGDSLRGNINVAEDGLFYTSIPAINGWSAYVDGEKVDITPVGGAMVAFKLSKGAHIIELKFMPEGFKVGLLLSGLGLLLFIVMIILSWRRINLLDMVLVRVGRSPRTLNAKQKAPKSSTSDKTNPSTEAPDDPVEDAADISAAADPAAEASAPSAEDAATASRPAKTTEASDEVDQILSSLKDQNEE